VSDERAVSADAVQLFVEKEGIRLHFGREVKSAEGEVIGLETVAKVVVAPTAFRRLGMSLPEVLRHLPRAAAPPQRPAAAPPQFTPPPPPRAQPQAAPARRPSMPAISFIGSSERPTSTGTTPASQPVGPDRSAATTAPARPPASEPSAGATKPPLEELLDPTADMPSSRATAPVTSEHASRLVKVVSSLGAPYALERSFRMRAGELLPNRILLSVGRPDDGSASDEKLTRAFRDIGLPAAFVEATRDDLAQARCVHFGFEGDGEIPRLKVYLEVGGEEHVKSAQDPDAIPEPVLEHVAYKWKPGDDDAGVVGRYWWYPHMTAEQIRTRVAEVYHGDTPESQEIAFEVIALAAGRMPERDIHYLEIEEDANPRRSYSINFYDADLKVRDLYPVLGRMRTLFDVQPGRFQVLYDQIKTRRFGHLAGGVHRNGKDFFNVYYGPQFFDKGARPGPWRSALLRGASGEPPIPRTDT
jgi:hypothetical protein